MIDVTSNATPKEHGQYRLFEDDSVRDPLCFDIFFDEGPFGILLLDKYFHVTRANQKTVRMLHSPSAQLVGRSVFELLDEENSLSLRSVLQHSNTLQAPLFIHLCFLHASESLLLTEGYIRRYVDLHGEYNYCMLLFESEFSPNRQQLAIRNEIYQTIIDTQEEERRNIGSALHDSVAQLLYGMRLNLQHFVLEHGNAERIMPVKKMLNEAIHEIRNISMELFPSVIEEFGLGPAITSMADRFSFPGFRVTSFFQESCEALPQRMKLAIYRIVQELLNNSMKHAMANQVLIRITRHRNQGIRIDVTDNGRGFSHKVDQCIEEGMGLRNIRSRIRLYQGEIRIQPGNPGTKISVRLLPDKVVHDGKIENYPR